MSSNSERGSWSSRTSSKRDPTTHTIPDPNSVEEHGRTFHGYREGKYFLPNDGDEQDRLDIQHKAWFLVMKEKLYWAPINEPKRVLDIGTGTGIWAIHLARLHPNAHVTGTDLSLIQPASPPANVVFLRDDAEDPDWVFAHRFDFVHLRVMCTCFNDSKAVLQRVYDHLEDQGWVEWHDFGGEVIGVDETAEAYLRESPVYRYWNLLREGLSRATGRDMRISKRYKSFMQEIGFTNVVERQLLSPVNGWPLDPDDKLLGQFTHLDIEKAVGGSVKLLLAAGMAETEVPDFVEQVKYSLADANLRAYYVLYVVYGQKPSSSKQPTSTDVSEFETLSS